MEFSLDTTASPPEPTRLTVPAEHSQLPTSWGTILKPPVTFLFEGTGLSVRFQYLSENIKQFESNTIWKALGGSHYLRTCHGEEKSTLIFRRDLSHLGIAETTPPAALAEHTTIPAIPSSLFKFPCKRLVGRNPTRKVPCEAPPTALQPATPAPLPQLLR